MFSFYKKIRNKKNNIILNFLAQGINISFLFIYLPFLRDQLGGINYGLFVLYHTAFLILFQLNHIYSTLLKLLKSENGKAFIFSIHSFINLISLVFFIFLLVFNFSFFGIIYILLSTFNSFIIQAILVKKNFNSLSSFILPFLNIFLILGLIFNDNFSLDLFIYILSSGFFIINIISLFFLGFNYFKLKFLLSNNKWNYLFTRTIQTSYFSFVTILQTNIDKFIIPIIFDLKILGIYHLIILIPSRISSIYGNIALAFSKQIHESKNANFNNFTIDFFKYSSFISFFAVFIISLLSTKILLHSFNNIIEPEYIFVFFISIFISLIQSLGFYSFQLYSRINRLYKMALINFYSVISYVVLILILSKILTPLISLSIALFLSKFSEFYNAYYLSKKIKKSIFNYWIKYFILPLLVTFILYLYGS